MNLYSFLVFDQGEMLKSERERLRKVISEAVLLLCKNSCMVESLKVSIEGIIGITLGEEDVILVSFKEEVKTEADAQNAQEKSKTSHELVAVKRAESDDTGRRLLTRRSKDCAIAKMTQAVESVEISETEESSSNRKPAKRKRADSRSEENQKLRTSNQDVAEPVRSLDKGPESKKPASDQSLDVTSKPYSNAWVKSEISNILSEHLTESNEFSVEPSSMHTESTVAREITSDDSVASDIPKNQPDITEYDEALSSILKLPSQLDDDATAADMSNPNMVAVKCEDKGADDDCVFVKSEIFEVTDNQTFDMQITGEEEFFGEGSVPFPESGPVIQSVDQLPSSKSRYIEYIQRGCVVQVSENCFIGRLILRWTCKKTA